MSGDGNSNGPVANDTIQFILDGELIRVRNPDPTRTVLQFLREDQCRTGTKEGCAEGDCGACTVALAELDHKDGALKLSAINACIRFLPTLDGKELITVESLNADRNTLHPVQQAMVDCHGSQCGFCTPGFIMSLFVLYKSAACANGKQLSRRAIDDALAGNLCRCTGYRPIIAAAQQLCAAPAGGENETHWVSVRGHESGLANEKVRALQQLRRTQAFRGECNGQVFIAPRSTRDLADALARIPDATLLAGGTDVGLWVTKDYRELGAVVYLGEVAELHTMTWTDTHLQIGSAVSLTDAMPEILREYPELDELLRRFASPPIRNAATLGGNIANGSPIGDSMPALMVIGTRLVLNSQQGQREIALEDFYQDYMVNALEPGEYLQAMRIPRAGPGAVVRSYKVSKRFDQDISSVCAAFQFALEGNKVVAARVAYGGLAAVVKRALACEQAVLGKPWNEATLDAATRSLASDFTPMSDLRATAAYRMRVAQNLLRRFYLATHGDLSHSVYEYGRAS